MQYLYVKGTLDERVGAILRKKQELMQPLYTSFSLAEVPLHERQPPDLEAHLSEMRERAAAARERVQRLSAEDATDKQSFEQLARDARAQLEARQRDERERLEVKVRLPRRPCTRAWVHAHYGEGGRSLQVERACVPRPRARQALRPTTCICDRAAPAPSSPLLVSARAACACCLPSGS